MALAAGAEDAFLQGFEVRPRAVLQAILPSARQAGAIPFSIGPDTSEFAPMSFAPAMTRFTARVRVSSE